MAIDQIVLSPSRFLTASPGTLKNDATIYPATDGAVDAVAPTVTLTAPSTGATAGGTVAFTATASDNVAVARVEFVVDGTVVATDTTPPYEASWDSTTVVDGPHSVSARAIDGAGNSNLSAAASIAVTNAPPVDLIPPTVMLTAPGTGATLSGSVAIAASASDNVGVVRVDFLVDGTVVATATAPPYGASWNSASVADGTHTLAARAYDAAANVADSAAVPLVTSNVSLSGPSEIVLYASSASTIAGAWRVETDATAAGGARVRHPDAGAAKLTAPLAAPINYFELTFTAVANVPYHLWLRGRADRNSYENDSVFVQFSNATAYGIGTTAAATVTLEDCTSCGVASWGWQDNGLNSLGANITFTTSGPQTIRIQTREDGLAIDQVILSPARFLTTSPGALKNDTAIYLPQ
jgi:hypothetical protein